MRKVTKGFTLPEVLVSLAIFLLFILTMLGMLIMGMRYLNKADAQIVAQRTCRNILDTIVSELRQGVPNPDPGGTGYLSVTTNPTAVLYPNESTPTTNYILFTEPNYARFNPSDASFNRQNPDIYQRVKYYVQNNILYREEQTITGGNLDTPVVTPLAEAPNGEIQLSVTRVNDKTFDITVTVTVDKGQASEATYSDTAKVFIAVE